MKKLIRLFRKRSQNSRVTSREFHDSEIVCEVADEREVESRKFSFMISHLNATEIHSKEKKRRREEMKKRKKKKDRIIRGEELRLIEFVD